MRFIFHLFCCCRVDLLQQKHALLNCVLRRLTNDLITNGNKNLQRVSNEICNHYKVKNVSSKKSLKRKNAMQTNIFSPLEKI